jgi:hypothetical protein
LLNGDLTRKGTALVGKISKEWEEMMTPRKLTNKLPVQKYQLGTNPDGFNKANNAIPYLRKVA